MHSLAYRYFSTPRFLKTPSGRREIWLPLRLLFKESEILNTEETHNALNVEEKIIILWALLNKGENIENVPKNNLWVL